MVSDSKSILDGRSWAGDLLAARCRQVPQGPLAQITLSQYEQAIRWSLERGDILSHLSPHAARHGGPSHDYLKQVRLIPEIQDRGLWAAPASVARYKRTGVYARVDNALSSASAAIATQAAKELPYLLLGHPDMAPLTVAGQPAKRRLTGGKLPRA